MKPIIMSTEEVRGILDGRKMMARMPIKPQPYYFYNSLYEEQKPLKGDRLGAVMPDNTDAWIKSPYRIGDVLYVRETWRVGAWDDAGGIAVDYRADGFARREWLKINNPDLYEKLWQQSSDDARKASASIDGDGNYTWLIGQAPTRWRSPITMPREAARLFLRVKTVQAEKNEDSGQWEWVYEFERISSSVIGPEPDETAPNSICTGFHHVTLPEVKE